MLRGEKAVGNVKKNEVVATVLPSWQEASCSAAFHLPDSSEEQPVRCEWRRLDPNVSERIDAVAKVIEQRGNWMPRHTFAGDAATVPSIAPKPMVKAIFVGPFVLDTALQRKAELWEERLGEAYAMH
jgi:hypothetical protein